MWRRPVEISAATSSIWRSDDERVAKGSIGRAYPVSGPCAVLIGAPGAGKSTVGRRVAGRLGVDFRDTDADIVAAAGKPVSDIFVEDGEAAFRSLEREAVARALREHTGVLSLGGGAVTDPHTRQLLADEFVVWLRVDAGHAAARVGLTGARPLLLGNVRGRLITLLEERTPLYEEVSDVVVDTDEKSVDAVVDAVVEVVLGSPDARPGRTGDDRTTRREER